MKRVLAILTFIFASVALQAQNESVMDMHKPAIPVYVADSLSRFDVTFDYSIFNRPYADLYDFNPYEAIRLQTVGPNRTPLFYAKLGAQYPLMPNGEIHFQTKPRKGFCAGLYGRHNSFFGDLKDALYEDDIVKNRKMRNSGGGNITYDWSSGELMVDAQYNYDRYAFEEKGREAVNTLKNFALAVNVNSAHVEDNSVYYDVTASYRNSKFIQKRTEYDGEWGEGLLKVSGYVGATFDIHRVYINMNIDYASNRGMKQYTTGLVEFSPIYAISRKFVDAKLGVKFGTTYGLEDGTSSQDFGVENSIFPDIDTRFTLIDKSLWIRTVVTGGNDLNQVSRFFSECPMTCLEAEQQFAKRNIDVRLSVESVIKGRLGLNLLGSFVVHTNKLYFIPDTQAILPRIYTGYLDVNEWSVGMEAYWNSQDIKIGGKFLWHKYTSREENHIGPITEFPAMTANGFVRYNFRERIIASLDFNYKSKVSGNIMAGYKIPAIMDANFNVDFILNRNFALFLKCGNIFNRRNQYMPLYLEPGRNFGGGVCVNF